MDLKNILKGFKQGYHFIKRNDNLEDKINIKKKGLLYIVSLEDETSEYFFQNILEGKSSKLEQVGFYTGVIMGNPRMVYRTLKDFLEI